jgi:hypothetical protein
MMTKQAFWVAFLAGALASAVEAQQSGKAVAVDAGSAPSADYVYVVCNGDNTVRVRRTDGSAVTTLTAALYGFNAPYDVVASPANRLVFVSNAGANPGTVTVINADTLQPVQIVTVPTSLNLHGMSLSEDESVVFIAGQDAGGPAVFQMNTASPFGTARTGGLAVAGGAEDCVVIRSANVGGSGDGPGRVYFSVPRAGAAGRIGIINLNPASPAAPIQTGVGALASIELADKMERTRDHRVVFVGCSKIVGSGSDVRIVRIDSATSAASATIVNAGVQDLANNRSWDVSWTSDTGGNNRGFVLIQQDSGTKQIREILDTGLPSGAGLIAANQGGLTDPITLRYAALSNQVFVGDIFGTGTGYSFFDAANTPLSPPAPGAPTGVGNRCQAFAVAATPAVVVTDVCPRAALSTGPLTVTIHGAGFTSACLVDYGAGTVAIGSGLIDTNTAIVSLTGAAGSIAVNVSNPQNLQSGTLDTFFRAYNPEVRAPFTVSLPSASQGYQLVSLPQYATLTSLKSALSAALGPYNPVLYRVFFYRGSRYVELNALADDGCDLAGESFWVLTRNGATLTMSEPDVRLNDAGADRVIPLNTGFNLVSVPDTNGTGASGQIPWASVRVTTDPSNFVVGSPSGPVPSTSAAGLLIVDPAVEFVKGGYFLAPNLIAGQGVWVRNISGKPAYLVFQPGLVTKPSGASFSSGVAPAPGSMPPAPPSGITDADSRRSGCGFTGLEWLLPILAVRRALRRRRLPA